MDHGQGEGAVDIPTPLTALFGGRYMTMAYIGKQGGCVFRVYVRGLVWVLMLMVQPIVC